MRPKEPGEKGLQEDFVLEPTTLPRVPAAKRLARSRRSLEVLETQVGRLGPDIRNRSSECGQASRQAAAFADGLHGAGEPWTEATRARARAEMRSRRVRVKYYGYSLHARTPRVVIWETISK